MAKQILRLPSKPAAKDPAQTQLDLLVERQIEEDGIGMGVLRDGTPFLNQRGLGRLCGVENRYIGLISSDWTSSTPSGVTTRVRELLDVQGELCPIAAYETYYGKKKLLAYPDTVCMAVLEYFAFEAGRQGEGIARENFRKLARHGLRQFIYARVGYEARSDGDLWQIFRDRVSLTYDVVPNGYFSVFKELASLIVTLGLNGLHIDESFVPDISVGKAWAQHWEAQQLSEEFGSRSRYPHQYPNYFPQAASNPQMSWCYPEDCLGVFRRWFREDYIGRGRLKSYLTRKIGERLLPEGYVERAMLALTKDDRL